MSNDPKFANIDCDNVNAIEKIICDYAAESRSMNNLIDSLENAQYHATTKLDEDTFNHIKEWITSNDDECHKKLSLYLEFAYETFDINAYTMIKDNAMEILVGRNIILGDDCRREEF